MARDLTRRVLFDTVAELYDSMRPTYPKEMVDEIVRVANLNLDSRILEIGPGTGQATKLFAERGYSVLGIELGANMAAKARENLADYPNAIIQVTPFEEWPVEVGAFDVVISGSAFHWIPPEVGFPKCAEALKPGGWLALFWAGDPGNNGPLREALDQVYASVAPDMKPRHNPGRTQEAMVEREQSIKDSGVFEAPTISTYAWSRELNADEYVRLCCTYSDHIALPEDQRTALCTGIKAAIEEHGGKIERKYLTQLYLARKL
jgi:SAM-dependent methyltransferase